MYELPKHVQSHILPALDGTSDLFPSMHASSCSVVTMSLHEVCTAFFSSRLSNCFFFLLTYPHTVVLETLMDNVKLNFFYLSVLWNYYAYTYSFFDNISHTVCEKTAIHSLVCLLRSLLLTTCSVIVQTSSTIWQFSF